MKKRKYSWKTRLAEDKYLPPELLREVLARLPVKTLLKFRCVCKLWCSLIDSSDFIHMHLKLYNNMINPNSGYTRLLAVVQRYDYLTLSIRRSDTFRQIGKLGENRWEYRYQQSCNGLMLIKHIKGYQVIRILWNPSIRKSLILPDLPNQRSKQSMRYILGFAPSSNDYKVLAVEVRAGDAAVYSLNDHRWTVKTDKVSVEDCGLQWLELSRYCCSRTVFSEGVMYWVGRAKNYEAGYELEQGTRLFCFDFDVEEFRFILLPDAVKESEVWFIFPHGESVAVFTMSSKNSCIWTMDKDAGEDPWNLWFCGEANSDASSLLKSIPLWSPSKFLFCPKSNLFLITSGYHFQTKLMSYNPRSHKFQHLGRSIRGQCQVFWDSYVESLVLHKRIEGQTLLSSLP